MRGEGGEGKRKGKGREGEGRAEKKGVRRGRGNEAQYLLCD